MKFVKFVKTAVAGGVACAGVALAAGTASAQGYGPMSQAAWSGFYVGGHAGYGWARDSDPSINGFAGGIHAGYNWQTSSIVLGVEGDYTLSGMSGSSSEVIPGIGTLTFTGDVDYLWSVRARLGFLATNTIMVYGTAGYGGFGLTATGALGGLSIKTEGSLSGLVAGGGVEMALSRNLLARVEGLHYMGKASSSSNFSDGDVTVIRAGLSYKF